MKQRDNLARPRDRQAPLGVHYKADAFGKFSESIARLMGTARFLIIQTILVIIWITLNVLFLALQWDKYPFILLNLMFSVQAAYAAPLILLAQNRQELRDRRQAETDRAVAASTQANAEFLARELASVRLVLANVVTVDELRDQLEEVIKLLNQHNTK
ncbi:MAG: DUF1003 domain-containing protein [Actinobacteria bacterium]|jgi:uncharacterized membrane protein|uniref:Unannotated protein n=1 Tax=freshwater metagenome TaxID=449393 RepID=A0A6J6XIQ0_9ZZZZ|nr:DUF1003 domain-containing protein [Actinomycetota bacterium]